MKVRIYVGRAIRVFLSLSVLFFALNAPASNVRVIGTGGDPALMEALSLFGELPRRIAFCALKANSCDLSESQAVVINRLHAEVHGDSFPRELSFNSPNEQALVERSSRRIRLPAGDLEKLGVNRAVYLAISKYYEDENIELTGLYESLFNSVWRMTFQPFGEFNEILAIERNQKAHVLLLDKGEIVKDLTPILNQSFGCAQSPKLLKAEALESTSDGVIVNLVWSCSGEDLKAKAWIGLGEGNKLSVHLFGVGSASLVIGDPVNRSCEGHLIP